MEGLKVGSIVRCMRAAGIRELVEGKFYTVKDVRESYGYTWVDLVGVRMGGIDARRFNIVDVSKDPQKSGGLKYDSGKLLFSCLTRGLALPLRAVAAVLTYGAQKYKRDSWQTVPNAKERYEDALDRHLNAWKSGEQRDEESGMLHLAHAACNVLFIMWFEITENKVDVTKFNDPKGTTQ